MTPRRGENSGVLSGSFDTSIRSPLANVRSATVGLGSRSLVKMGTSIRRPAVSVRFGSARNSSCTYSPAWMAEISASGTSTPGTAEYWIWNCVGCGTPAAVRSGALACARKSATERKRKAPFQLGVKPFENE